MCALQIQGLEDLLAPGQSIANGAPEPASGIPHAAETYQNMLESARQGGHLSRPVLDARTGAQVLIWAFAASLIALLPALLGPCSDLMT
jgi:hypothetical protein